MASGCRQASLICHFPPAVKRAKHQLSPEALVLSHEEATMQETEPYLQRRLAPLRPLIMYGRSASLDPPCAKDECVYYGWRDRRVNSA